jgi:hypothetical protein
MGCTASADTNNGLEDFPSSGVDAGASSSHKQLQVVEDTTSGQKSKSKHKKKKKKKDATIPVQSTVIRIAVVGGRDSGKTGILSQIIYGESIPPASQVHTDTGNVHIAIN